MFEALKRLFSLLEESEDERITSPEEARKLIPLNRQKQADIKRNTIERNRKIVLREVEESLRKEYNGGLHDVWIRDLVYMNEETIKDFMRPYEKKGWEVHVKKIKTTYGSSYVISMREKNDSLNK